MNISKQNTTTNEEVLKDARDSIRQALKKGIPMGPCHGNYSEQVVTFSLCIVAEKINTEAANDLIDEFNLTRFGWEKQK